MRGLIVLCMLLAPVSASAKVVASLNLWSWGPKLEQRIEDLAVLIGKKKLLKGADVLLLQEVLQKGDSSTAHPLAKRLGWGVYFQVRAASSEGLAILHAPSVKVLSKDVLQIKAKHDDADYHRMALSLQADEPGVGRVRFVNTHLAHAAHMAGARARQLAEIIDWLGALEARSPSARIILGGDFNTAPAASYYGNEFRALEASKFGFALSPSQGASYSWIDFETKDRELVDHFFVADMTPARQGHEPMRIRTEIVPLLTEKKLSDHNLALLSISPR